MEEGREVNIQNNTKLAITREKVFSSEPICSRLIKNKMTIITINYDKIKMTNNYNYL